MCLSEIIGFQRCRVLLSAMSYNTPFVIVTPSDLREIIKESVCSSFRAMIPNFLEALPEKRYLTKKEVSDLTGWSIRQIDYKRKSGAIPYIKRGRLVLIPTADLLAYLEEGRVPAARRDMEDVKRETRQ